MSRRDTIIIAVLVNAALLMILFVTAVRSDPTDKKEIRAPQADLVENGAAPLQTLPSDDLLNQFITAAPTVEDSPLLIPEGAAEEIALVLTPSEKIPIEEVPTKPKIAEEKLQAQMTTVTVKKGDFLEKIAKANQTTVQALMKANNLSSTQLKIGQVLKIPASAESRTLPLEKKEAREPEYYIVKEGDNPWLIASKNHLNLDELLKLNHLDEQKAKKLKVGDRLRIR